MTRNPQKPPITMYRDSDGRVARFVRPGRAVARFEELGYRIIPHGEDVPTGGDPHAASAPVLTPAPPPAEQEPFDFASLTRLELKGLYGRAMSEGVDLPPPPGAAGVKWFSERLQASGWEPKTHGDS